MREKGKKRGRRLFSVPAVTPPKPGDASFQEYLNQSLEYWRDFGKRSAQGMLTVGVSIPFERVDGVVADAMQKMLAQTGRQLSEDRADAYAEGIREELLRVANTAEGKG